MKYKLSDEEVMKLMLLLPVKEFKDHLGDIAPSRATIYRTLNKYDIYNCVRERHDYRMALFAACSNDLNDRQRYLYIDERLGFTLKETIADIKRKAKIYEERTK